MNVLSPVFLEEVEAGSTEHVMWIVNAITPELVVDGKAYGDVDIDSDEDFVMVYLDLETRGILPYLAIVNEKLARQWRERFERASARVMGLR
jgi:hypothetical protein